MELLNVWRIVAIRARGVPVFFGYRGNEDAYWLPHRGFEPMREVLHHDQRLSIALNIQHKLNNYLNSPWLG